MLVDRLVVHVDALVGCLVDVSAGLVHDLVDAVDQVGDVDAFASGRVAPCAAGIDELVELLFLRGHALRVRLCDVAECEGGVGERADQILFDFEHPALEAERRREGRVDDLHAVPDVDAFRVETGSAERGHRGRVADRWLAGFCETSLAGGEQLGGIVDVAVLVDTFRRHGLAVRSGDAPLRKRGRVGVKVRLAVVDVADADLAAVSACGFAVPVGLFHAFAPAPQAGDDVVAVDGPFDGREVLAVFEPSRALRRPALFKQVDVACLDGGSVHLDASLQFEAEGVADVLERVGHEFVVEGEIGLMRGEAGLHGSDLPFGSVERLREACRGGGRSVAAVFDVDLGELAD